MRGSAVSNESNNALIVRNCIFENCGNGTNGGSSNTPVFGADGIGKLEITRCLVYNSSRIMPGIVSTNNITITNCTFANLNGGWGGVIPNVNKVKNTIIYKGDQNTCEGSAPIISYCLFTGHNGAWANPISELLNINGNMDKDPLFVDPDNGDYRLKEGSPCIDAGDPNSPKDPDGTITDIGFYSFSQGTDIKSDGNKSILNNNLSCQIVNNCLQINSKLNGSVNVVIYDFKGKTISSYSLNNIKKHYKNLNFLSKGIYCIKVNNFNTRIIKTFHLNN